MRIAINGRFLTRSTTGVDRYAREIVRELDSMVAYEDAVLVIPSDGFVADPLPLQRIESVRYGSHNGHLWEQIDFCSYCKRESRLGLNLCGTAPISEPGFVCIHDAAIRANTANFDRKFVALYRILYRASAKRAKAILTVSEFSKKELEFYYPAMKGRITVAPPSWQHMDRIASNRSILENNGLLCGGYWFAMSSLTPNKNLKWLVETALRNPGERIVVAGGMNARVFGEHRIPQADNVLYLGYVTDEEAKTLLANCKAFLYPTFYEGFGLPPLEALACGTPVIVSDTEVMHEVYGGSAIYIDPRNPADNLDELVRCTDISAAQQALDNYSWRMSAKVIKRVIESAI